MLANVSDEELNDVPRVGPLRRKLLKDAFAFYETNVHPSRGFPRRLDCRISQTSGPHRKIEFSQLDDQETGSSCSSNLRSAALSLLLNEHLDAASRVPNFSWRKLAARQHYIYGGNRQEAEDLVRRSSELYGDLANAQIQWTKSWLNQTGAFALGDLGEHLALRGKPQEAADTARCGH